MKSIDKNSGSVLIIVLWTSALLTVLVTAMAGAARLSAIAVSNNHDASIGRLAIESAISHAEMELLLERMPRPIGEQLEETEEGEIRTPAFRFNGQTLDLSYPKPSNIAVRIYDHAGKININRIPRRNMQLLIENRLGGEDADPAQVQDLLAAWTDWTDLNDLEGLNGAESDYYQSLDQAYLPRNNPELDTVEEILHIRGFAELLEGVNLQAAFTIYGNARTVNLNLATREAMQLLPGLNDELIENIIAYRQIEDINNRAEIAEIVPFTELQELSPWVGNATSNFYTIYSYFEDQGVLEYQDFQDKSNEGQVYSNLAPLQAFMEIVQVTGFVERPTILRIDPYGVLPDSAPSRIPEDEYNFR